MHDDAAAFFQTIRDEPDDPSAWLVFADWLDEHGDHPRAEFVRLQVGRERLHPGSQSERELMLRGLALAREHGAAWKEGLPAWVRGEEVFRRGFLTAATCDAAHFVGHGADLFRLGPAATVRLIDARDHAAALAECPHLARVRSLELAAPGLDDVGAAALAASPFVAGLRELRLTDNRLGPAGARALAASPYLAGLRLLVLSRCPIEDAGGSAVAAAFPALRRLEMESCGLGNATPASFGGPPRPLAVLSVLGNHAGPPGMAALAASPALPDLAELTVSHNPIRLEGLRSLMTGRLARLRRLAASACSLQVTGAAVVPLDARPASLVSLDLSANGLGNAGARWLARSHALAGLRCLDVGRNDISDDGAAALEASPFLRSLGRLVTDGNPIGGVAYSSLRRRFPAS